VGVNRRAELPLMFSSNATQVSSAANYIEDVFSTYLYTGTGASQTITNGVDLSSKGGLVWMKGRSGGTDHALYDTVRGATFDIATNLTTAQTTQATGLTAFGTTGFTIGSLAKINTSTATYVSWTFRDQAKFFDVVTYTGNGANRTISHSLGSVPGSIIIKATSYPGTSWYVYHRSLANTEYLLLNTSSAKATDSTLWNSTTPTSTNFSLGTGAANGNGISYVAYIFAHDAGGFGATGTDNVISCGSFTTDGSGNATVTLGYEPQWLMLKQSSASQAWLMIDNMRGVTANSTSNTRLVFASSPLAESAANGPVFNATGFTGNGQLSASATFIYIAIRRGPMKTPTTGTSVFQPNARTGTGVANTINTNFTVDLEITKSRNAIDYNLWAARLTGVQSLISDATNAATDFGWWTAPQPWDIQNGFYMNQFANMNGSGTTYVDYFFRRAPGFFDVVCYTGTGVATTVSHNLGVPPELMIVKKRSSSSFSNWAVYVSSLGNGNRLLLDATSAVNAAPLFWNSTTPTSSVFTLGTSPTVNESSSTFIAYLFATVAGVSKVGSYTGTGTTNQINCGFTGGARFVLIKRTDSTGDWYVWDSARGIVAGNDPYLLLNSTAAEVTNTDYVDTYSAGFEISSTAPAAINANGGTFIFLAIA